ncbi:MAG TPA: amidohydrolase/deacetylase family metallohydrolase, partial [Acidobacteriota bacterium]|nr:amidohydrolase/deacetylase family metallohydrolase [Acidobacteriota bacterium]
MKPWKLPRLLFFVSVVAISLPLENYLSAQHRYDLLIRSGHVIDPRNEIDGEMDVAVLDGKIAQVSQEIPPEEARRVVDATGLIVAPGLIDIHVHAFYGTEPHSDYSDGFLALPPDGFTLRSGVTTAVDTGGSGWRNFRRFKENVIDRSQTRILAMLNIVGAGMKGDPTEQDLNDMDPKLTAMMARQFPELIVGVKVAHYRGPEWDPVQRAVEAGGLADLPVMVDFGRHIPPLSLQELLLERLRPGDIFTHAYAEIDEREPIVGPDGRVRSFA